MDTAPTPLLPSDAADAPVDVADRRLSARPEQPRLPLPDGPGGHAGAADVAGEDHDEPIGFALTARARRVVAPDSLPELAVVPAATEPAEDDPDDTRPARARALRRAGVPPARIAAQLDADPLLVTAWTREVRVRSAASGARRSGPVDRSGEPGAAQRAVPSSRVAEGPGGPTEHDDDPDEATSRALARAEAARRARARLATDPVFALAAGLLAGLAEVDAHAVTVTSEEPRLLRRVLDELASLDRAAVGHARVVVRTGPAAAGDLVRHRTAAGLGLELGQVTVTRWRTPPRPDALQLLLRVADPHLADQVAGAIEAVLDPQPDAEDDGF